MRFTVLTVGKLSEPFAREGCAAYAQKIQRYADFNLVVIPEERVAFKGKKEYIVRQESQRIQKRLPSAPFIVVLDEKGKTLSSEIFAKGLEKWSQWGAKELVFILGGPYGLDAGLKEKADFHLSFSPMTLSHGLARIFLLEQLYRALTILRGEPYAK